AHAHVIEHLAGVGQRGEMRAIGNGKARWIGGEEVKLIPDSWGDASFPHDTLVKVMDRHGVSKAVLMQGSFYGFCNDYTFEAQQSHPGRLFGMGTFDPYAHQSRAIMEHLIRDYKFRGLKFEISRSFGLMGYHPDLRIDGDPMTPIWEFAEKENLVVSLDLGTFGEPSFQIEAMARIAGRYAAIRFIIEHLFYPGPRRFNDVRSALGLFVPLKNVFFTIASIPNSAMPEAYPFPTASRYAGIARDIVGADRILWGSDLPSVVVNATYRELIDYIAECGLFSTEELRKIYTENANRVYRLEG
ncbi:MAG: amidohydrolase family protein, partial [Tepidisphaeraceae bacterium]